jgi:hypothetical protein
MTTAVGSFLSLALSVKQPWAELIVLGRKTIEVRSWLTDYRGPLLIHTGKNPAAEVIPLFPDVDATFLGGFIGIVDLVGVEPFTQTSWSRLRSEHLVPGGMPKEVFGWRFAHARRLPTPIPGKGRLGLFAGPDYRTARLDEPSDSD